MYLFSHRDRPVNPFDGPNGGDAWPPTPVLILRVYLIVDHGRSSDYLAIKYISVQACARNSDYSKRSL
jgi:hypothetical protein